MSALSWLNPTPHAIAVYASRPLSPVATQPSLPSGRYSLLGPDFHRLDRTSLRLAHSFYAPGDSALLDDVEGSHMHRGARTVEIRKLDTLSSDARIPLADYIKMDCEGFESEVLIGARHYLATSAPLCVTTETNFATSPTHLHTHFSTLNELLLPHGLRVFDLSYVRAPYPNYTAALSSAND